MFKHINLKPKLVSINKCILANLSKKSFTDNLSLTHTGANKMVNIGNKSESLRYARAGCLIKTKKEVIDIIKSNSNSKGDVLRTSEIAGIMGTKKTSDLIPLCHQINLNTVKIKIEIVSNDKIYIESYAETHAKTGVEMEAMVGASISALTIYDMCKSADKDITITEIKLLEKFGGKSGHFISNSKINY